MRKLRIVHVTHEYYPTISGVAQVVQELAERQVKAGHDVHVYTADWDKKKRIRKRKESINGVKIIRFRHIARMGNFASVFPGVFLKLLNERFDIIHSHVFGHVHFVLAALATKVIGAKHVHTTHCPWSDAPRSSLAKLGIALSYNLFSRVALKATDKIIAITPWEYDFIKKYGGAQDKIVNLPNGMAEIFFKIMKKNDFKRKNKIKDKLVLFFGRLSITKGPEKFVDIAKIVLKKRPRTRFVIRGPDEGMREVVKKKIGDEKRIILLGETRDRKEVVKMYQAADVFVLPSYREGLPLTLFEAMAAGLPIVASPVNGVPFEMHEPENGFLVKYGDDNKFAERVVQLLDDKKLRDKISRRNIKLSKRYRWDLIAKQTEELYYKLLR